jgi:signal transduction histidine kinase/HAMP domain-containing protein
MSEVKPSVTQNQTIPAQDATPGIQKWSVDYPMRIKILVSMLLIALIPLGLFIYLSYQFVTNLILNVQSGPLVVAANQTTTQIDSFINHNSDAIRYAAEWSELGTYLDALATGTPNNQAGLQVGEAVKRLEQQDQTGVGSFALLDSAGKNVYDSNPDNTGQNEAENVYFSQPFETGQPYISPILFDSNGEGFIVFSNPVYAQGEAIVGVFRARYSADVLQELINGVNGLAGPNSASLLIDENNMIIANGIDPVERYKLLTAPEGDKVEQLQAARRLPQGPATELYTDLTALEENLDETRRTVPNFTIEAGEDYGWQGSYSTTSSQPWRVVFLQPEDAISNLVAEHLFTQIILFLGLALVIFLLALNVSRYLTNSLVGLANVTQQVGGGAYGLYVPVETRDEVGLVAHAFNQVTAQLREVTGNVDRIILERTHALGSIVRSLETSTKIGRQITTVLDREELLRQVVNRIQIEFSFYYTHIYLVDADTGDLIMAEGSGEVGRRLKARGHRLAAGEGIVGTVARSNEFFLSNDVSKVLNYVANTELPNTRSELALPLRKGDRVLGVLDIQDNKINRFTAADVSLMQSIANQTAIAIDNARLLAETQTALKEVERLNRRLTREGWDQFEANLATSGYRFVRGNIMPLTSERDTWVPPVRQISDQQQLVKQTQGENGDSSGTEIAVPLVLRGEVIGMLGVKRDEHTGWGDEEVAAIEAVAGQVALAMENARLSTEQEKTIYQLKEVDRLKDEFLTSMSHELRTPLNSIIGFADVILQGIDGVVNDLALNDVRLIHNSGKHLLALINDVLDLAKIEAGRMELVHEELNIKTIIDDVIANTGSLVMSKPVDLVSEIDANLPHIYADETRFRQVLINLISNAAKFTDAGQITIKAERYPRNPDNFALFSVIDTGIGIPANMIGTVFDRFGQVASVKTRKVGGTGLGLPICKQLVEMHNGFIEVTSEEGVGSNFHFTIPFVGAELGEDTSAAIEKLLEAAKNL